MGPLLDTVLNHVPNPPGNPSEEFSMLVAMVEHDSHLGKICTGRVHNGTAKIGDKLRLLPHLGKFAHKIDSELSWNFLRQGRLEKTFSFLMAEFSNG